MEYDVAVVGAGIVGLSTAYHLSLRHPELSLIVLEKESRIASHQTGRNSGVIHSGIYYKPGSLKARNCREGKRLLAHFCEREGVTYEMCGKVIVAVEEQERPLLRDIYERGLANGISCEIIGREKLREIEPHAVGVEAIYVPEAGIVDFAGVARRLAEILSERGGRVATNAEVRAMERAGPRVILETASGDVPARYVVNCAGLYADRVAQMSGHDPEMQIIPFRGEYFELKEEARYLCRNLIYPVPNPAFPFLGVHFTRMFDGRIECGPNAVLAFAREGYRITDVDLGELFEILRFGGFRRLARRHWKMELYELWRSVSKRAFVKTLQRLIPAASAADLVEAKSGVRAQAVLPNGDLADDFVFKETERILNVCNAPSPAATASLKIGEEVAGRLEQHF